MGRVRVWVAGAVAVGVAVVAVAVVLAWPALTWHTWPVEVPPGWTQPPPPPLQTGPVLTVDERLPAAMVLPDGLLASTDGDWFVARFTGSDAQDAQDLPDPADVVRVYELVSPDGDRYQIRDVTDTGLYQWLPGTVLALGVTTDIGERVIVVVDLETGAQVAEVRLPLVKAATRADVDVTFVGDGTTDLLVTVTSAQAGQMVRTTLDGTVLASLDGTWHDPLPAPDGRTAVAIEPDSGWVVAIDLATLHLVADPFPSSYCENPRWLDARRWLVACYLPQRDDVSYVVDGQTTRPLPVLGVVAGLAPNPDGPVLIAYGVYDEVSGFDRETVAWATADGVVPVETGQSHPWGPLGTAVLDGADGHDDFVYQSMLAPVTAWHPTDSSTTVLVPAPERGATRVLPLQQIGQPRTLVDFSVWGGRLSVGGLD